jgi:hypothetical protein
MKPLVPLGQLKLMVRKGLVVIAKQHIDSGASFDVFKGLLSVLPIVQRKQLLVVLDQLVTRTMTDVERQQHELEKWEMFLPTSRRRAYITSQTKRLGKLQGIVGQVVSGGGKGGGEDASARQRLRQTKSERESKLRKVRRQSAAIMDAVAGAHYNESDGFFSEDEDDNKAGEGTVQQKQRSAQRFEHEARPWDSTSSISDSSESGSDWTESDSYSESSGSDDEGAEEKEKRRERENWQKYRRWNRRKAKRRRRRKQMQEEEKILVEDEAKVAGAGGEGKRRLSVTIVEGDGAAANVLRQSRKDAKMVIRKSGRYQRKSSAANKSAMELVRRRSSAGMSVGRGARALADHRQWYTVHTGNVEVRKWLQEVTSVPLGVVAEYTAKFALSGLDTLGFLRQAMRSPQSAVDGGGVEAGGDGVGAEAIEGAATRGRKNSLTTSSASTEAESESQPKFGGTEADSKELLFGGGQRTSSRGWLDSPRALLELGVRDGHVSEILHALRTLSLTVDPDLSGIGIYGHNPDHIANAAAAAFALPFRDLLVNAKPTRRLGGTSALMQLMQTVLLGETATRETFLDHGTYGGATMSFALRKMRGARASDLCKLAEEIPEVMTLLFRQRYPLMQQQLVLLDGEKRRTGRAREKASKVKRDLGEEAYTVGALCKSFLKGGKAAKNKILPSVEQDEEYTQPATTATYAPEQVTEDKIPAILQLLTDQLEGSNGLQTKLVGEQLLKDGGLIIVKQWLRKMEANPSTRRQLWASPEGGDFVLAMIRHDPFLLQAVLDVCRLPNYPSLMRTWSKRPQEVTAAFALIVEGDANSGVEQALRMLKQLLADKPTTCEIACRKLRINFDRTLFFEAIKEKNATVQHREDKRLERLAESMATKLGATAPPNSLSPKPSSNVAEVLAAGSAFGMKLAKEAADIHKELAGAEADVTDSESQQRKETKKQEEAEKGNEAKKKKAADEEPRLSKAATEVTRAAKAVIKLLMERPHLLQPLLTVAPELMLPLLTNSTMLARTVYELLEEPESSTEASEANEGPKNRRAVNDNSSTPRKLSRRLSAFELFDHLGGVSIVVVDEVEAFLRKHHFASGQNVVDSGTTKTEDGHLKKLEAMLRLVVRQFVRMATGGGFLQTVLDIYQWGLRYGPAQELERACRMAGVPDMRRELLPQQLHDRPELVLELLASSTHCLQPVLQRKPLALKLLLSELTERYGLNAHESDGDKTATTAEALFHVAPTTLNELLQLMTYSHTSQRSFLSLKNALRSTRGLQRLAGIHPEVAELYTTPLAPTKSPLLATERVRSYTDNEVSENSGLADPQDTSVQRGYPFAQRKSWLSSNITCRSAVLASIAPLLLGDTPIETKNQDMSKSLIRTASTDGIYMAGATSPEGRAQNSRADDARKLRTKVLAEARCDEEIRERANTGGLSAQAGAKREADMNAVRGVQRLLWRAEADPEIRRQLLLRNLPLLKRLLLACPAVLQWELEIVSKGHDAYNVYELDGKGGLLQKAMGDPDIIEKMVDTASPLMMLIERQLMASGGGQTVMAGHNTRTPKKGTKKQRGNEQQAKVVQMEEHREHGHALDNAQAVLASGLAQHARLAINDALLERVLSLAATDVSVEYALLRCKADCDQAVLDETGFGGASSKLQAQELPRFLRSIQGSPMSRNVLRRRMRSTIAVLDESKRILGHGKHHLAHACHDACAALWSRMDELEEDDLEYEARQQLLEGRQMAELATDLAQQLPGLSWADSGNGTGTSRRHEGNSNRRGSAQATIKAIGKFSISTNIQASRMNKPVKTVLSHRESNAERSQVASISLLLRRRGKHKLTKPDLMGLDRLMSFLNTYLELKVDNDELERLHQEEEVGYLPLPDFICDHLVMQKGLKSLAMKLLKDVAFSSNTIMAAAHASSSSPNAAVANDGLSIKARFLDAVAQESLLDKTNPAMLARIKVFGQVAGIFDLNHYDPQTGAIMQGGGGWGGDHDSRLGDQSSAADNADAAVVGIDELFSSGGKFEHPFDPLAMEFVSRLLSSVLKRKGFCVSKKKKTVTRGERSRAEDVEEGMPGLSALLGDGSGKTALVKRSVLDQAVDDALPGVCSVPFKREEVRIALDALGAQAAASNAGTPKNSFLSIDLALEMLLFHFYPLERFLRVWGEQEVHAQSMQAACRGFLGRRIAVKLLQKKVQTENLELQTMFSKAIRAMGVNAGRAEAGRDQDLGAGAGIMVPIAIFRSMIMSALDPHLEEGYISIFFQDSIRFTRILRRQVRRQMAVTGNVDASVEYPRDPLTRELLLPAGLSVLLSGEVLQEEQRIHGDNEGDSYYDMDGGYFDEDEDETISQYGFACAALAYGYSLEGDTLDTAAMRDAAAAAASPIGGGQKSGFSGSPRRLSNTGADTRRASRASVPRRSIGAGSAGRRGSLGRKKGRQGYGIVVTGTGWARTRATECSLPPLPKIESDVAPEGSIDRIGRRRSSAAATRNSGSPQSVSRRSSRVRASASGASSFSFNTTGVVVQAMGAISETSAKKAASGMMNIAIGSPRIRALGGNRPSMRLVREDTLKRVASPRGAMKYVWVM